MSPKAQAIAEAIAEAAYDDGTPLDRVAEMFADALEREGDPDFDRAVFLSACGVEP